MTLLLFQNHHTTLRYDFSNTKLAFRLAMILGSFSDQETCLDWIDTSKADVTIAYRHIPQLTVENRKLSRDADQPSHQRTHMRSKGAADHFEARVRTPGLPGSRNINIRSVLELLVGFEQLLGASSERGHTSTSSSTVAIMGRLREVRQGWLVDYCDIANTRRSLLSVPAGEVGVHIEGRGLDRRESGPQQDKERDDEVRREGRENECLTRPWPALAPSRLSYADHVHVITVLHIHGPCNPYATYVTCGWYLYPPPGTAT